MQTLAREAEEDEALDPQQWAREMMVQEFGPRTSAWLLWNQKAKLHRRGQFDVTFRPGQHEPPWFQLAVAQLRRREGWSVDVISVREHRRFRVRWHGWMQRARVSRGN